MSSAAPGRPPVSVVVPFRGDRAGALRLRAALAGLRRAPGDELIVADNSAVPVAAAALGDTARVVRAGGEPSAYHARNAGARTAANDWLLFVDADCVPEVGLLDAHLSPLPAARCGAVAGTIASDPDGRGLAARYVRSRRFFDQRDGLHVRDGGAATGNLLVRAAAFTGLEGFAEGIRSGGDVDFCLRLRAAGWAIESRPAARVSHSVAGGIRALLARFVRYGAGARWLRERHTQIPPPWPLGHGLALSARDVAANALRGRFEEATFRAIDAAGLVAYRLGYASDNAPR